jgi:uncharacterized protein DUF4124
LTIRALLLSLALIGFVSSSAGQAMYKWTDAQGRIQYSDRAPKDFKGEVTRIEADAQPEPAPPAAPKAAPAKAQDGKQVEKAADDLNTRRRNLRAKLAADVKAARDKLEAARKALEEAEGPQVGERQVVQQRFARGTQPKTSRSNCREIVASDGKKSLMCPALVPGESYYDRIRLLEEAVARAEEELTLAERAFRQGAD